MSSQLEELKQLIIHNLDVDEFLDILGYDLSDLVERLSDELEENYEELRHACK
tara:strand:+ start:543 stop:701 length:159 start_codon:yes stop_codon:yes gene_type:complete